MQLITISFTLTLYPNPLHTPNATSYQLPQIQHTFNTSLTKQSFYTLHIILLLLLCLCQIASDLDVTIFSIVDEFRLDLHLLWTYENMCPQQDSNPRPPGIRPGRSTNWAIWAFVGSPLRFCSSMLERQVAVVASNPFWVDYHGLLVLWHSLESL